jgi:hypothetical protein
VTTYPTQEPESVTTNIRRRLLGIKKKKKAPVAASGPLLAARALPLRCADITALTICTGYA